MDKYKVVTVRDVDASLTIWSGAFPGNTFFGECSCGTWQRKASADWNLQKAWADHVRDKHSSED